MKKNAVKRISSSKKKERNTDGKKNLKVARFATRGVAKGGSSSKSGAKIT